MTIMDRVVIDEETSSPDSVPGMAAQPSARKSFARGFLIAGPIAGLLWALVIWWL